MSRIYVATEQKQDEILTKLEMIAPADPFNTPGPKTLIAGTLQLGYFGHTPASELITGTALASAIGLSAGTAQHSDDGWLKWIKGGKLMYVARKPQRYAISWDAINARGAVFGTAMVTIGNMVFSVRLLTGGNANPAAHGGGEWNEIMYGVHKDMQPNWENYTDSDIVVGDGNGRYSWCQETSASNASLRVGRGDSSVANFYVNNYSSYVSDSSGWRPVLELL